MALSHLKPIMATSKHTFVWNVIDIFILALMAMGLFVLVTNGFNIVPGIASYMAVFIFSAAAVLFCKSEFYEKHRLWGSIIILILWLMACFVLQERFINGAGVYADCMSITAHRTYSGGSTKQHMTAELTDSTDVRIFLVLIMVPVIFWLALTMFVVHEMIMVYMIIFPVILLLALLGAADFNTGLVLVLVGVLLCKVFMGTRKQYRMWGGGRKKLRWKNANRYENIQKTSVVMALIAGVILFVPGYFIVRPLLSVTMKPLETVSVKVQSSFLSKAVKILPDVSAGKWNLNLEAPGGGVYEGSLQGEEGYLIDNVEDLKVTIDTKPEETIFLKGFVGSIYNDGEWKGGYGTTFDAAAMNWNTDGSPRLYVQNLPFLRISYKLAHTDTKPDIQTALMNVERINANDKYTYFPYGVYLNDYYTVESGDCYVAAQSEQEDSFPFYFRKDMKGVLSERNIDANSDNVMDRVEESYRAYCESNCLEENISGADDLARLIDETIQENRWKGQQNIDDITAWIRAYLDSKYSYEKEPEPAPGGVDSLEYFMFTSKRGNSVQFASAAAFMYRMFGIPARYVVGYELPYSLFTAQPDGTYTATVRGENSQAWVEIYKEKIGWMPEDMTPGVTGSYDEVGPGGELVEQSTAEVDDSETDAGDSGSRDEASGTSAGIRNISMKQIVMVILFVIIVVSFLTVIIAAVCWYFTAFGYTFCGRRTHRQRLIGEFRTFYCRMRKLGLAENIDSQNEEFIEFCENELEMRSPDSAALVRPAVLRLYAVCYGKVQADDEDIAGMRELVKLSYKRRKRLK